MAPLFDRAIDAWLARSRVAFKREIRRFHCRETFRWAFACVNVGAFTHSLPIGNPAQTSPEDHRPIAQRRGPLPVNGEAGSFVDACVRHADAATPRQWAIRAAEGR